MQSICRGIITDITSLFVIKKKRLHKSFNKILRSANQTFQSDIYIHVLNNYELGCERVYGFHLPDWFDDISKFQYYFTKSFSRIEPLLTNDIRIQTTFSSKFGKSTLC